MYISLEERHPWLLVPACSHVAVWPAVRDMENRKSNLSLGRWQLASGTCLLASICISSAQAFSVSSQSLSLSQVENRVTNHKWKALHSVVSPPSPMCGTFWSATFVLSPAHLLIPLSFLFLFHQGLTAGYAGEGWRFAGGKFSPFGCSMKWINGVTYSSLSYSVWLCHSFK